MSLSKEQQAAASQWESLAPHIEDHVKELNETLKQTTYIAGTPSTTDADLKVFKAVSPLIESTLLKDVSNNRHILRWFDLLQNTVAGLTDSKVKIDLDVELPREIKEKPKKKDAAAQSAAPADAKAGKKDSKDAPKKEAQPPKGKPTDPEAIAKAKAAKEAKKAAKAKQREAQEAQAKAAQVPPNPAMIDLRVGFIEKAIKHPDADSLYVSTIQMGDEDGKPRTVCSGLVKHFELEEMQERYVIVVANLKPVTMRGIKSCAMVLCASNEETGKVEFVNPPEGSKPGDKIFFEGYDGTPEKQLNPKKKIWETVQPHFTTIEDFTAVYREEGKPDAKLINKAGQLCKCSTLIGAQVR